MLFVIKFLKMKCVCDIVKERVEEALRKQNFTKDDISYINLTNEIWMTVEDFFSMDSTPSFYMEISENGLSPLDGMFMMMKDGSMFKFIVIDDEDIYSQFVFIPPPKLAPKRFIQIKIIHEQYV